MDNEYFIDRATLEKFVDPLIPQKHPEASETELAQIREDSIKKLDDLIGDMIFSNMTSEQLEKINQILDDGNDDPDAICEFLDDNDINLEQKIAKALEQFKTEFLGGDHA